MKEIKITRTVYEPGDIIKDRNGLRCVIIRMRESKNGLLSYIVLLQNGQKTVKTESDLQKAEFETHSAEIERFFHIEEEPEKPKKKARENEYILKSRETGEFVVEMETAENGDDACATYYDFGTENPEEAKRFTREEAIRMMALLGNDKIIACVTA